MIDIRTQFAALQKALEHRAKIAGNERYEIAAMQAALAIGELVVTDLRRIADAAEASVNQ